MIVRPLREDDERQTFRTGVHALDDFLLRHAWANHQFGLSRVHVAVDGEASSTILGYHTLSNTSISSDRFEEAVTQRLPRFPIPAILVGRLATDERHRGKGIGTMLLRHALRTSVVAADISAALGVLVDAKHQELIEFYERFGFVRIPPQVLPQPMFLPMASLRQALLL